jgi:predicted nucleic-acid-binding Zn-ribbon protein
MSNIVDIDNHREHSTVHAKCKYCGHAWMAVYPTGLPASLQCPKCTEYTPISEFKKQI